MFTFRGTNSRALNMTVRSIDRSLLPALRRNELTIAGRHGRYDFGNNKYDNRIITLRAFIEASSLQQLRQRARKVAQFLSVKGELVFDDEPDKRYIGRIYSPISFENIGHNGEIEFSFELEPFAYGERITNEVTRTDDTPIYVFNSGNFDTPSTITITNTGEDTIDGLTIRVIKN